MEPVNKRVLGNRIREARENQHISQEELGKKFGWQQSNVSRIENGRLSLDIDQLGRLAEFLGVHVAFLVREWFEPDGDEEELLLSYRRLSPLMQANLRTLAKGMAEPSENLSGVLGESALDKE